LGTADNWLKDHIGAFLRSPEFRSSVVVIVFDESSVSDSAHGGGHVVTVVVSPYVKKGVRVGSFFQHQSTLKLTLQAVGLGSYPGAASSAPTMGSFF
jgi:hypothetical protein